MQGQHSVSPEDIRDNEAEGWGWAHKFGDETSGSKARSDHAESCFYLCHLATDKTKNKLTSYNILKNLENNFEKFFPSSFFKNLQILRKIEKFRKVLKLD